MRVAIACCGLEHVRRGFESASRELFNALSGQVDVTLFKGSGPSRPNEVVVPCLRRDFLLRFMNYPRAFYWEQVTFAIALIPYLMLKRIDIVHYSEGNVGNVLARLLRKIGSRTRLVLWNGGPLSPQSFRPDLFIQQVSKQCHDQALEYGIEPKRMRLIPYGVAPEQLRVSEPVEKLRERFGLPADKFLILSLAALSKGHKRLDYLIREVAAVDDNSLFLCMAGEPTPETAELEKLATDLLPGRHKFLTVPRAQIAQLLAAANLFVHAAFNEAFGMVLLEACAAGVPVVCNDVPHFHWVLEEAGIYIDVSVPGSLANLIPRIVRDQQLLARHSKLGKARVDDFFSWRVLLPRYLDMYEAVCNS